MSACTFPARPAWIPALLLLALLAVHTALADEEGGWIPEHIPPAAPWQEQTVELPAYPKEDALVQVSVLTGNYPYDVFVDTGTLEPGADGVIRYVAVVRSRAGAENISFEGIHCKERRYRRYAYGFDNDWQRIDGSDWQPLKSGGMDHYRFVLYRDYLCDSSNPGMKVNEMIQRMRYSRGAVLDE